MFFAIRYHKYYLSVKNTLDMNLVSMIQICLIWYFGQQDFFTTIPMHC